MRRAIRLFLALAIVCGGVAPAAALTEDPVPGAADDSAQAAPDPQPGPPSPQAAQAAHHSEDGRRTMGRLFTNLGRGSLGVFSTHSGLPLAIGSTLTMGAAAIDLDIKDDIADPGNSFGKTSSTIGGAVSAVFVGGLFVGGRIAHGQRFRNMTYDMLDGAVINGAYTQILKVAVGRERPNGANNHSFPSGHASNAFTLAVIAQRHYGWKLGVPAYAFAAVVGYSRIMQNAHYLSDVVAGATLGYIVGQTVVRVNNRPLAPKTGKPAATWNVSPILGRDVHGLGVTILF